MNTDRKYCFESARRVVVKVGSNILTKQNALNLEALESISRQISRLIDKNLQVLFVSSGAVACGITKVGLKKRPEEIPLKQAAAAVGQAGLILAYENAFERYGKKVAQILLIGDDLTDRKRYLNARNTLHTLLSWDVVPIINENDTVSVEEIKFGDNDSLAARITLLMDADVLINLTDIDGLYSRDPRRFPDAELIGRVSRISDNIESYAGDIPGTLGTGGMLSKIKCAKKVNAAGIPMVIANGNRKDVLLRLFALEEIGTFFVPRPEKLTSRKCWIVNLKAAGAVRVDDGAASAIVGRGKSLLPSGIISVEGEFHAGDSVEVINVDGDVIGAGLVNYTASEIRKIMGCNTRDIENRLGFKAYDEVIHRNNLTILNQNG
jgi:glutamate 5-kinase